MDKTLELYDQLMALCEEDTKKAFYFTDQERDGVHYRIFLYRLASYTDFLKPGALECRGTMYRLDGRNPTLVCLPMQKFFNLYENPMTMDLDLSQVNHAELKMDGSLISTYWHMDKSNQLFLGLKSKGSIQSEQAVAASEWLQHQANWSLQWQLRDLASKGYTVNMEWCAPDNRIVVGYTNSGLTVLNVRSNHTGEYVAKEDLNPKQYGEVLELWTPFVRKELVTPEWVDSIPQMTDIEGYIVHIGNMWVKIKTEWYLTQHRAKDSINSDRRLYETVLAEATDDLRTLFHDDPLIIERIEWMEQKVEVLYNNLVANVEAYYDANRHLERKDYAIKGQKELSKHEFGLAMSKYIGRTVNYKEYMANKWKEFGIEDQPEAVEV